MAVQKRKKSRSRSAMRRANIKSRAHAHSTDAMTGELHLRHRITATGYYRGKPLVDIRIKPSKEEEEEEEQR